MPKVISGKPVGEANSVETKAPPADGAGNPK